MFLSAAPPKKKFKDHQPQMLHGTGSYLPSHFPLKVAICSPSIWVNNPYIRRLWEPHPPIQGSSEAKGKHGIFFSTPYFLKYILPCKQMITYNISQCISQRYTPENAHGTPKIGGGGVHNRCFSFFQTR